MKSLSCLFACLASVASVGREAPPVPFGPDAEPGLPPASELAQAEVARTSNAAAHAYAGTTSTPHLSRYYLTNKQLRVAVRSGESGRSVFGYSDFGMRILERLSQPNDVKIEQLKGSYSADPANLSKLEVDVLPAVFWLPSVTNAYSLINQPIAYARIELAAAKDRAAEFNAVLPTRWPKDLRIAYVAGVLDTKTDFDQWARRSEVTARLCPFDDILQAQDAVLARKCDLLLAAVWTTPSNMTRVADIRTRKTYFAVRKDKPALRAALEHDFRELKINQREWLDEAWYNVFGETVSSNLVRVATYLEPGLVELGPQGEVRGYMAEYLNRVASLNGWVVDYVFTTFDDAVAAVRDGKVDLVGGVTYSPTRQKQLAFSRYTVGMYQTFLYSRVLHPLTDATAKEWRHANVVMGPGEESRKTLEAYFAKHGVAASITVFPAVADAVRAYRLGAADALYAVAFPGASAQEVVETFMPMPWYFCTSRQREDLREQLDETLVRIQGQLPGFQDVTRYGNTAELDAKTPDLTAEERAWLKAFVGSNGVVNVEFSPEAILWKEWDAQHQTAFGLLSRYLDEVSRRTGLKFAYLPPATQAAAQRRFLKGEATLWASYMADLSGLPPGCKRKVIFSNPVVCATRRGMPRPKPGATRFAVMETDSERREALERRGYGDRLVPCATEIDCFEAILENRADATILAPRVALVLLRRLDALKEIEISNFAEFARLDDVAFEFSPAGDPTLAAILSKAMDGITALDCEQMIRNIVYSRMGGAPLSAVQIFALVSSFVMLILTITIIVVFQFARRARRSAIEASAIGAAKTQFLSTISHEIRTPLNVLVGFANFLKQPNVTPDQVREYTDGINLSAQVLLSLINDVLDLSKLEAGKMDLAGQCVLPDLFSVLRVMFANAAKRKGLKFDMYLQPGLPIVGISSQRLRQILFNLISNAIKYTEKGQVRVEAVGQVAPSGQTANLTFRVSDTGIGISRERAKAVFNPFEQDVSRRGGKVFEGTGLGLAIVKRLVEAAGGEISLDTRDGVGTTFTVFLPALKVVHQKDVRHSASLSAGASAKFVRPTAAMKYEGDDDGASAAGSEARLPPELPVTDDTKILVVDDVALNLRVFSIYLKKLGVRRILTAVNGRDALKVVEAERPSYVFTDMWMPEMNGSELAEAIRRLPYGAGVRIVAVTADADSAATFRLDAFDAVMTKPVTEEKVVSALTDVHKGQEAEQAKV